MGTVLTTYNFSGGGFVGALRVLSVVVCVSLTAVAQASAQSVVTPPSPSQKLALESIDYLHRGEDASGRDERMSAFRRGVELARQAIAADENNADAHFAMFANQGRIMELQGVAVNPFILVEATRELNRALEINPNHADALAAKGGVYRQLPWALGGSAQKASEYLARSVELDPDNACGARIELAELYRDLGQPERSIPLLEKAVEVAKRDKKREKLARAKTLLQELNSR